MIPARLASTRLPDKPLVSLLGRPLIEWVWRRAHAMSVLDDVVVATDDAAVAEACGRFGARVEMTRTDHPSGTDRIAEVVARPAWADYPVIVNVQGDEPLLREEHVAAAVGLIRAGWPVATCATPLGSIEALSDPSVVKVARTREARALYFSRAGIPHRRDAPPSRRELEAAPFLRHIGLYAYTRRALQAWVALPPSPLEELERLEQLRPLEAGFDIGVAVVEAAEGGVDTPADALRMERRMTELGLTPVPERHGTT
ncbi:3-deoxy-manno-octulosonate cytidylyltransferase [Gaopeijia maritima]|uniref:3-deoxy-manno-octulosonate cytidylyltransferase n=1 Tax=Gaopeijia maritima TaxID=3119007 RepID=A0ABU9E650_9BACT